uniref:Adaptor related protein complex 5 subunit sigma 1 n=1 Tax=Dromaius novaehollandiae TaxID=8790 RepID=A0A8C4K9F7_DRONO
MSPLCLLHDVGAPSLGVGGSWCKHWAPPSPVQGRAEGSGRNMPRLPAAAGRAASPAPPQLPDEPVSLQAAPGGLFRLRPGDPFSGPATVVWLAVLALGFALVCEPHENLLLAESTLRRLARRLLGALRLLGPGAEALLRAGHAEALLDRLLPHGQLLFLGEAAAQALEREAPAKALR